MDVGIRNRIRRGFGANVYNQIVTAVIQLTGVPILLHAWGVERYGEWLILFSIPAYLSMTDLGFSLSAANDMTALVAKGNWKKALAVFQSLGLLICCVSFLSLILITILLYTLPLERWFRPREISIADVRWILWCLGAEILIQLSEGTIHAGFRATGDYALHRTIYATSRLIQYIAMWIVASTGGQPSAAAFAYLSVRFVATPCTAVLLIRRHSWLHFGFNSAQKAELTRLLRPAIANTSMPLAQALSIQGMVLVVGAVLGPLSVVVFSTLRTLTRFALQLVLAIVNAAEPELASAYGSDDIGLMRSLFVHIQRLALWFSLSAAAFLSFSGSFVLTAWTQGKVTMHSELFLLLLSTAVANTLWIGMLTVLKSANCHLRAASVYVVSSASGLGLAAFLLFWTHDITTVGMVLLTMDTAMTLYVIKELRRALHIDGFACLLQAFNPYPLVATLRDKVFGPQL